MGRVVAGHHLGADVGVAVTAAVRTGVVRADVDAGRTAAARPLAAVFFDPHRLPQDVGHQALVNAPGRSNPALLREQWVAAGAQLDLKASGKGGEAPNKTDFLAVFKGQQPNSRQVAFAFCVHAEKADGALAGASAQLLGQLRKGTEIMAAQPQPGR